MKRIEAIIRPEKVSEVCAALDKAGHPGATVSSVEKRDNRRGWVNLVRSAACRITVLARARVEVVVNDTEADRVIQTICDAAVTGGRGDGRIFIHDVTGALWIGPPETGAALS
jgi:nitrogen regulatory protein P-II 1